MAKSPKDKVIHKAMKSADKFYNEIPGKHETGSNSYPSTQIKR